MPLESDGTLEPDIFEKIAVPCKEEAKSCMCGIGYRSGTVLLFRAR